MSNGSARDNAIVWANQLASDVSRGDLAADVLVPNKLGDSQKGGWGVKVDFSENALKQYRPWNAYVEENGKKVPNTHWYTVSAVQEIAENSALSGNPYQFGLDLHKLQDSYAHSTCLGLTDPSQLVQKHGVCVAYKGGHCSQMDKFDESKWPHVQMTVASKNVIKTFVGDQYRMYLEKQNCGE